MCFKDTMVLYIQQRKPIKREGNLGNGREYFMHTPGQGFISKIYKELVQLKTVQLKSGQRF